MSNNHPNTRDEDSGKGAVEQDQPGQETNVSRTGEIGHRDQDALLKSSDTDFPEPGQNPEHSGELQASNQLNRDTELACQDKKHPPAKQPQRK
jgi:hypothetical protein